MSETSKTTLGLERCQFSHGQGIQKQWVENNDFFLKYVGSKFSHSARVSLVAREVIVTEVGEDLILRFNIKANKEKNLATLKHQKMKLYHSTLEDYIKISRKIRIDLSIVHGILYGLCDTSLYSRLEAELVY